MTESDAAALLLRLDPGDVGEDELFAALHAGRVLAKAWQDRGPGDAETDAATERLAGNWYDAYGCTGEGLSPAVLADIRAVLEEREAVRGGSEGK